jgi:DNA replication protein DnaC
VSTGTLELRLKAFRLPSFLAHYAALGEQAAQGGWSHVHYLDELAAVEAVERSERRIARLRTESRLPHDKTMATLDPGRFPAPVRTQLARLAEGQFLEGASNLCVFGNPGTGKTHVVCALGHELVRQGHTVFFTPVSTLVERLLEAKRDLRLTRELRRLDRIEYLILDDIGYVQHDRSEMEVLFALLAERYERRSVAITSNLVFSKWDQIFKDPMTTAAAIDRVVHHSVILELNVKSYRAEEAHKRTRPRRAEKSEADEKA